MAAQIIDGTAIAKGIRQKLNAEIGEKQRTNPRYKPSLVIIQGVYTSSQWSPHRDKELTIPRSR
jgi:hypothetical protein